MKGWKGLCVSLFVVVVVSARATRDARCFSEGLYPNGKLNRS